jgi:hypothetical protein
LHVGFPGDDVSAPKSSSCQNSYAAIVSSGKSASASASGISINHSQQQSTFNQLSSIRASSPNSFIPKPKSRLPVSVIDTNVVKPHVPAPKTGSPRNSLAAIVSSTTSASTSACGISKDIQQSNSNNHSTKSPSSSSPARSNLPLSVSNGSVVKHNVSAPRICSAQNSSATNGASITSTSATASGISDDLQRNQTSQASTSSAGISSISSLAPVAEIKHAPVTPSSREFIAVSQTQRTKQVHTEDHSIASTKPKLRILFSPRAPLNPQSSFASIHTSSSSSSSPSIAVPSTILSEVNLATPSKSRFETSAVPHTGSEEQAITNHTTTQIPPSISTPARDLSIKGSSTNPFSSSSAIGKRKPVQLVKNKKKKKGKGLLW